MKRSEIVRLLAKEFGFTTTKAEAVVTCFFDTIENQLRAGGRVEFRGFGTFGVSNRKAITGRNPRTGAAVDVPAKPIPRFRASKLFYDRLNT